MLITAGAILPVLALFILLAPVQIFARAETTVTTTASVLRGVNAWRHLARVQIAAHVLKTDVLLALALVKTIAAVGSLKMDVVCISEQTKLIWSLNMKDPTRF
jgi:hypothetical protein